MDMRHQENWARDQQVQQQHHFGKHSLQIYDRPAQLSRQ